MIKYTPKPECPKCGNDWIDWEFSRRRLPSPMPELPSIKFEEYLLLKCRRCEHYFEMQTKDAEKNNV